MTAATLLASAIEYKGPTQQQQQSVKCEDQIMEQDCKQYIDNCRWHNIPNSNDCKSSLTQEESHMGFC